MKQQPAGEMWKQSVAVKPQKEAADFCLLRAHGSSLGKEGSSTWLSISSPQLRVEDGSLIPACEDCSNLAGLRLRKKPFILSTILECTHTQSSSRESRVSCEKTDLGFTSGTCGNTNFGGSVGQGMTSHLHCEPE